MKSRARNWGTAKRLEATCAPLALVMAFLSWHGCVPSRSPRSLRARRILSRSRRRGRPILHRSRYTLSRPQILRPVPFPRPRRCPRLQACRHRFRPGGQWLGVCTVAGSGAWSRITGRSRALPGQYPHRSTTTRTIRRFRDRVRGVGIVNCCWWNRKCDRLAGMTAGGRRQSWRQDDGYG